MLPQFYIPRRSKAHRQKLQSIYGKILKKLTRPVNGVNTRKIVSDYLTVSGLGAESKSEIRAALFEFGDLKKIPLKWNQQNPLRVIYSTAEKPLPLEIAGAFFDKGYLCFGTALFWNDLTDKLPVNFYVANERKSRSRERELVDLDDDELGDEFLKPPRQTQRIASYQEYRFTLVEREAMGFLGVVEKSRQEDSGRIVWQQTDVERTLLDCAMHPHYAGGIRSVMDAYARGRRKLRIGKMIEYYRAMDPLYPYWQRIGFLLKHCAAPTTAVKWKDAFGKPKNRFYADRPYRADWVVDEEWNVAYPREIL